MKDDIMLPGLTLGDDGVYGYSFKNEGQADEIKLREKIADINYVDSHEYLKTLSKHHSVPVMDREIIKFLKKIPNGGLILDIGGCWGWHWRNIQAIRPDVKVFIVDFIRSNLHHAKKLLGNLVEENIFLIHGDATSLIFQDQMFDGYWSVQTLQHIPSFKQAVEEAYRTLKTGGIFANYSLNTQPIIQFIYKLLGVTYCVKGNVSGKFYLARASREQKEIIASAFPGEPVEERYSEIIFKPELKLPFAGKENSFFGNIDAHLSNGVGLFSSIARQQSFHTRKSCNPAE